MKSMKIKDLIFQISDYNYSETLEYIERKSKKSDKKSFVVTINTELVMLAKNDSSYAKVLRTADLAVCDGIGVVWAGKMFGKEFKGRVHGVDLVEKVCGFVAKLPVDREEKPITVGFLGGDKNVALNAADCLQKKYPELQIAFALEEWPSDESRIIHLAGSGFAKNQQSSKSSHNSKFIIHDSKLKCDILFVAFGSPKQEKWIYENLPNIDVKVAIGVGGSFDFISGKVRRAPQWVQKIGLEWLFRLMIQPWRIKRQLAIPKFIYLVIKEKLGFS